MAIQTKRFPPHCSWRILSIARSTLQPDVVWAVRQSMACLARSPSCWPNGETLCSGLAWLGSLSGVTSAACVHLKSNLEIARLRRDPPHLRVEKKRAWQTVTHGRDLVTDNAVIAGHLKLAPTGPDSPSILIWTLSSCGATLTGMRGGGTAGLRLS